MGTVGAGKGLFRETLLLAAMEAGINLPPPFVAHRAAVTALVVLLKSPLAPELMLTPAEDEAENGPKTLHVDSSPTRSIMMALLG